MNSPIFIGQSLLWQFIDKIIDDQRKRKHSLRVIVNGKVPRLKKITADSGYKVVFKEHIETNYQWKVEVVQKPESTKGFIPQKWRWQVERSFGWLNRAAFRFRRRLFRDVEKAILSSEAMIQIAFISLIINRI